MDVIMGGIMLRRVYGDAAASATVARNLLAPVASHLSGSDLHRRCVLVEDLCTLTKPEDARAAFAPFGEVEPVVACGFLQKAVVVFESPTGASSALPHGPLAPALDGTTRIGGEWKAVPPLHVGPACDFIGSQDVKVAVAGVVTASPLAAASSEPSKEARAKAFQEMCERGPMIEFDDPPGADQEVYEDCTVRAKRFVPSEDSLVRGPTLGGDGHLWMHGTMVTYHVPCGIQMEGASIRVRQEVCPRKIRVTPLKPFSYVLQQG